MSERFYHGATSRSPSQAQFKDTSVYFTNALRGNKRFVIFLSSFVFTYDSCALDCIQVCNLLTIFKDTFSIFYYYYFIYKLNILTCFVIFLSSFVFTYDSCALDCIQVCNLSTVFKDTFSIFYYYFIYKKNISTYFVIFLSSFVFTYDFCTLDCIQVYNLSTVFKDTFSIFYCPNCTNISFIEMCTYFSFGLILRDIPNSITPQNTLCLLPIPVGLLILSCTRQCRRSPLYSLPPFFYCPGLRNLYLCP